MNVPLTVARSHTSSTYPSRMHHTRFARREASNVRSSTPSEECMFTCHLLGMLARICGSSQVVRTSTVQFSPKSKYLPSITACPCPLGWKPPKAKIRKSSPPPTIQERDWEDPQI